MPKLLILSGVSGSGKSTVAANVARALHADNKDCHILSADNYFIRPDGVYSWYARELHNAHQWCYDKFRFLVEDYTNNKWLIGTVVLDNTNLRFDEFKNYVELALKNNWEVEIVRIECGLTPEELAGRNRHNVPLETIKRQLARLETNEELQTKLVSLKV